MMATRTPAIVAAFAAALLLGCFSEEPETTGPDGEVAAVVEMTQDLTFSPATVRIRAGQAVEWRNPSTFPHTATADVTLVLRPENVELPAGAQPFHSGDVPAGGRYSHTFTVRGTYRYVCLPHESFGMVGVVIVE